jgi:seryl-tRNA synthetase
MKSAQSGKLSLSEFIESLIRSQMSLTQHIANNDLKAMSTIIPDLRSVSAEFKELTVLLRNAEAKLQETLNHVHNSCEELRTGTINKFLFFLSCILYI